MKLWDSYNDVRADLMLYFGQDLAGSGKLTDTRVRKLFESKPFINWKKGRENESKAIKGELDRLDGIIKAVGVVAQIIAKKGV